MDKVCIFLHGKESGPAGKKLSLLGDIARSQGWFPYHPDFTGLNTLEERAKVLDQLPRESAVLVGSSMGGLLALLEAQKYPHLKGLFLMAPALGIPELYSGEIPAPSVPTEVVMGWEDDVVDAKVVVDWSCANDKNTVLHLIHDNHRLSESHELLGAYFTRFLARLSA